LSNIACSGGVLRKTDVKRTMDERCSGIENMRIVHVCIHSEDHVHLGALRKGELHKVGGADWQAHEDNRRKRKTVDIDIHAAVEPGLQQRKVHGPSPQAALVGTRKKQNFNPSSLSI
jgi:hypothetical protein